MNDYGGPVRAPEFPLDLTWVNSAPIGLSQLRGKIIILDFWTYG